MQAMEASVKMVGLGSVTLHTYTLTYSGQGQCCDLVITCCDDDQEVWNFYLKHPLKYWALNRDWAVIRENNYMFQIRHKMCCK